MVWLK